jgi:acetyl esterase/lipase
MIRLLFGLLLGAAVPFLGAGDTQTAVNKNAGAFEVRVVKGIAYREGDGADPVRNQLDLYLPRGQKDFPVLLFVHGGFWKSGNKDLYEPIGKLYAKNGIGTVIINYRLSPKVKHPAHIQDVARAFAWTHDNIAKYGGDPGNIFVSGHSAGGHLVSLLSTNETYLKAENLAIGDIKGTIPLSGVHVLFPNALYQPIFTNDKDVVKSASPIEHVGPKHPPFLLIYAEKDFLTLDAQAEQMCKKLTDSQCEARTVKILDRTHISIITSMVNEADPANQAIFEFLAKHGGLKLKNADKEAVAACPGISE